MLSECVPCYSVALFQVFPVILSLPCRRWIVCVFHSQPAAAYGTVAVFTGVFYHVGMSCALSIDLWLICVRLCFSVSIRLDVE